nr:hypothetical protein [Tanacetum cinerariifolium]
KELRQLEQAANLITYSTKPLGCYDSFCYDDDDYEESTIPLNKIISQIPSFIVITSFSPVLPIEDFEDSLIMGNEELSTILKKESNEFIKSSVEDLVLIPSESEDTSGSDSKYDLSSCDDFSPIDIPEEKSVIFSNPLFDSNNDFTSSDDESLSDEDVLEDNVTIYSNPLFKFDDEYISSDVNLVFDEVLENIKNKDSYDSNLDEPDLLVTPLFDANEDECFDPGDDVDKIELLRDPSTLKMSVASILKGSNPFIEIPYGEIKVHIEVLSVLWGNRLPILDGSLPLFSDDESLSNEDVPIENFKIYSNSLFDDEELISTKIDPHYFNAEYDLIEPLLNRDTLIDSSPKFDYLLEEFSGELAHIDPIPPRIEEADFDLEEEIRLVENLFENNDYDSKGDIHFFKELLSNDTPPLPENKSSNFDHHDDPSFSRPPSKPPDVEPTLCPILDTLFLFSSENKDKVFKPGILSYLHVSHLDKIIFDFFKELMMMYGEDIPYLDVLIDPDLEASRAHGFVHRPLELKYLAYGNPISEILLI